MFGPFDYLDYQMSCSAYKLLENGDKCLKMKSTNVFLCVFHGLVGDLPYEAHVQTHRSGAPSDPPVASEDRVPHHPHPHIPHLSFPATVT